MELKAEQQKMIHSKPSRYALIRGVKGSGKTTAAIYRSLYLKNQYCLYEEDKVLMIASQEEDIEYINEIYDRAEEETKLDYLSLFSNKDTKFDVLSLESILYKYFLQYQEKNKLNYQLILDNDKKIDIMKSCILEIKNDYPKLKILRTGYVSFFIDEIKWIKSYNYLKEDVYLNANRVGRKCKKGEGVQRLLKNSTARKAIYDLMLIYNEKLREENFIDYEDINIYALYQAKKEVLDKYSHIVIDESNNLTKAQLDFISVLFNEKSYSSMTFLVNTDVSCNINSWMIRGKRVNTKPLGEKSKTYSFKNTYKTYELIDEYNSNKKSLSINSFENFQYCDIRHNRKYDFMRDYSRISDIIVNDEKGEYEYLNEELLELPVYSDIAAGEPILINSELEGNFYIPKYWLKGVNNSFILKVKGDSMIGANIHDGDYVVIRKQYTAENNDIVAVDIGGNATLKRLSITKEKILLMPENEKYNPIVVDREDTYIIGTAVGVIKHKN